VKGAEATDAVTGEKSRRCLPRAEKTSVVKRTGCAVRVQGALARLKLISPERSGAPGPRRRSWRRADDSMLPS